MTVRELKRLLERADEGAIVVLPASDHSYQRVRSAAPMTGMLAGGHLSEDFGDLNPPEAGEQVTIVVIDG